MYSSEEIKQLVYLIIEVADPDKIILFGSYVYGTPNDKSDLDFLVIKNGKDFSRDEHAGLETLLFMKKHQKNIRAKYDIFFQTERQVHESVGNGGAFVDAMNKGRVVYERIHQ